jgi:hypothetical protein
MDEKNPKKVLMLHECKYHTIIGEEDGTIKTMTPAQDGEPIPPDTEIVHFTEVPWEPNFRYMETIYRPEGPAKVSSPKYRRGWDQVFAKKQKPAGKKVLH